MSAPATATSSAPDGGRATLRREGAFAANLPDRTFNRGTLAFIPPIHGLAQREKVRALAMGSLQRAALCGKVKDKLGQSALALSGEPTTTAVYRPPVGGGPDVALVDEPCAALEPISARRIEELMDELEESYTIVIVTHNMQEAARVPQATGFFLGGELIEFGPSARIFTHPRHLRTEACITGRFG